MSGDDDGRTMDEALEAVRKRWLWRNQKAFTKGITRLSTFLHPAALASPPSPSPPPRATSCSPPPSAAALLGEPDLEEEEARRQRAIQRERERAAREAYEKKMKGEEGSRMRKCTLAKLQPKREYSADPSPSSSTSTISSEASSAWLAGMTPRESKKTTKNGRKEEEARESSLGGSRRGTERNAKVAPTKTLSYNVNLHAQVRLRKVQSFVYSSDERSPTSAGLVSKEKRRRAAKMEKEKEKLEKKESKKKKKEKSKKQKRVGKSKDDSFILRPTAAAGGRTTRSASDASAVTPRVLSMISKPLDEDDVVEFEGNDHHNGLHCTQTVVLSADLAEAAAAPEDFEERSRMLALSRAQQRATWVPPLDMAKLAPPTTSTAISQVRSPDCSSSTSSSSSSSYSSYSTSSSSCDVSPCTSSSSSSSSSATTSSLSLLDAPTTPGSPTGSLSVGTKRSGMMEWLRLRRGRGGSRGLSLPIRPSRSESNSSSGSSGLDGNDDEEAEEGQGTTATATTTITTTAAATTAIAIKAKLAGGLSGRGRRRRDVKDEERIEQLLSPGSAMAFVRREARYAVGLP